MPNRTERKERSRLERRAEDHLAARGESLDQIDPILYRARRGKTHKTHPFGIEHRIIEGRRRFPDDDTWGRSWRWYQTAEQRDAALRVLARKDAWLWEYRPTQR